MNIYIMRHGDAQIGNFEDKKRPLTETGELEVKVMAKWLAGKRCQFDAIFASPYLRAQQTAQVLVHEIAIDLPVHTLDLLTPDGDAKQVHDYLDGMLAIEKWQNILLVSHMPLVSYLSGQLTADQHTPLFPTASIAEIDYDQRLMRGSITQQFSPTNFC
ncbi:phosphohistidine phosphatase SixA [Thalassotalea maritima]|uniref:phosphohistidine phosphatase SixA n=1 Tax=Thalassotalea maritima TaxID=3242416 RepID=UPI003528D8DF